MYLFDWSLPLFAPELATELIIPKYFANDFLQRTPETHMYTHSWPSLFIGSDQAQSDLHVDGFGSNFWMYLFRGEKKWTFFDKKATALLYPGYEYSTDPTFDVNMNAIDFERHPLLALVEPSICTLQAGELLFVPAGCAHHVLNLSTTIAVCIRGTRV